jgi:hypothetical protein
MNTIYRTMRILALLVTPLAIVSPVQAAEPVLPREGWVSWEVPAVENAPAWCCWNRGDRAAPQKICRLDEKSDGYGTRDSATTDAVKVYAHVTGGKMDRLQALAASCPVETTTPINQLDNVTAEDSARWLIARANLDGADAATGNRIGESALAGLAMHRGNLARDALIGLARGDTRTETRKRAIFWLAILRGAEGAEITSSVMFNDKDVEVRKHAAFAMTQTKSPRAAPDLIRQGNTDKVGDVRAQAWFWLAHMGAPEAEAAIGAALRKDPDEHVREHAIFALSQLPDERATRALIAAAEDQVLSREQRKRAVFWLAQSESTSAQAYLERVLARNVAN